MPLYQKYKDFLSRCFLKRSRKFCTIYSWTNRFVPENQNQLKSRVWLLRWCTAKWEGRKVLILLRFSGISIYKTPEKVWYLKLAQPTQQQNKFNWNQTDQDFWKEESFQRMLWDHLMIWKGWFWSRKDWQNIQLITSIFLVFWSQYQQVRNISSSISSMSPMFLSKSWLTQLWVKNKSIFWLIKYGSWFLAWEAMDMKNTSSNWWRETSWVSFLIKLSTTWMEICWLVILDWFWKKKHPTSDLPARRKNNSFQKYTTICHLSICFLMKMRPLGKWSHSKRRTLISTIFTPFSKRKDLSSSSSNRHHLNLWAHSSAGSIRNREAVWKESLRSQRQRRQRTWTHRSETARREMEIIGTTITRRKQKRRPKPPKK